MACAVRVPIMASSRAVHSGGSSHLTPPGGSNSGERPAAIQALSLLTTSRDSRADWLRTGQALHRLLTHAAGSWVFASLCTQPTETTSIRTLIRIRLALPGVPQLLLQFGLARTAQATARRPPAELMEP
jgi:hypothetical protein